jgi:Ca2+-binding EF-hand superfamily protein
MTKVTIALAALTLAAGTAFANDAETTAAQSTTFTQLDTNKDGTLSRSEVAADASMTENFNKIDKNSDGRIDETEYKAATSPSK